VLAIGEHAAVQRWSLRHPNLGVLAYRIPDTATLAAVPPHLRMFKLQLARAEAVLQAVRQLCNRKLVPGVVVAHPGWGEAIFLRGALPDTPLLGYCEFHYRPAGADVGFDPEYPVDDRHWQPLQLRNMPHLLARHDMDAGWWPTRWQHVSAVHACLSYLFVLSWSLLEAVAAGCCIVGSAMPPVQEVIEDGVNDRLVDLFGHEGLARALTDALQHPDDMLALRQAARRTVCER
jgi:hypothetical protein